MFAATKFITDEMFDKVHIDKLYCDWDALMTKIEEIDELREEIETLSATFELKRKDSHVSTGTTSNMEVNTRENELNKKKDEFRKLNKGYSMLDAITRSF